MSASIGWRRVRSMSLSATPRDPAVKTSVARQLRLTSGESVEIAPVLRELTGRRISGQRVTAQGKAFAKAFIGRDAGRYADRELEGLAMLRAASVATAELIQREALSDGELLTLTWLEGQPPTSDDGAAAVRLAELLAKLHERDVELTDPHLGNFLLTPDTVACVDGDGVRLRPGLNRQSALANLGRLLAEFDLDTGIDLNRAVDRYVATRGWREAISAKPLLASARRRRRDLIDTKVMRECSLVQVQRSGGWRRWRWRAAPSIAGSIIDAPERWLADAEVVKEGNSAQVYRVHTEGQTLVLKRYRSKTIARLLRRAVSGSRAERAWRTGCVLGFFGVASPQPLALAERKVGSLVIDAWLLCEDAGSATLHDEAERSPERAADGARLLSQFAQLGLCHGDAKATNFMVAHGQVSAVDLDGVQRYTPKRWQRDCRRYLANWPTGSPAYLAAEATLASADTGAAT